jgi:hypothetical protein
MIMASSGLSMIIASLAPAGPRFEGLDDVVVGNTTRSHAKPEKPWPLERFACGSLRAASHRIELFRPGITPTVGELDMSAAFYWDQGGAAKDPENAVEGLRGNQARKNLSGFKIDYTGGVSIPTDHALFMGGTTSELQEAISHDMNQKIPSFFAPQGYQVEVRYIRRKAGHETKSLIGIASCDKIAQGSYWGLNSDGKAQNKDTIWVNQKRYPWRWWKTFGIADGFHYGHSTPTASLLLTTLYRMLAERRGEDAWM